MSKVFLFFQKAVGVVKAVVDYLHEHPKFTTALAAIAGTFIVLRLVGCL